MEKSVSARSFQSNSDTDQVLTITSTIYNALHPMDRLMVQSLQQIGKVRIIHEGER